MVLLERDSARFDALLCAKHIRAAAGGALHDISHRVVETIGWVRELGQLSRPTGTRSTAKASALKTRPNASSEPFFGSDITIIAVFMDSP